MLKKSLLAAALAVMTSSALAAAPVANLKIDGKVTPPTCTINGAEKGELVADFGAVSPSWLLASGLSFKNGSTITLPLTVNCDALTYMTFTPTDTHGAVDIGQSGTTDAASFSALVSTDKPSAGVGFSVANLKNMTVDGKPAFYGRQTSKFTYTEPRIVPGAIGAWTTEQQMNVSPNTLKLASGKIFTADVDVKNFLFSRAQISAKGIDLTEQVDYVGETVLAFNFGI